MADLLSQLEIERCPHCNVDNPSLLQVYDIFLTKTYSGRNPRYWCVYKCQRCGGLVIAASRVEQGTIIEMYPASSGVDDNIPEPARDYLKQALNSLHAPAGCVMLCASGVDAMLKVKDYREGSLYNRIDQAKENHLITEEMALWAHEVRLEANEPRHADETAPLPTEGDAKKCIDFALALGQFLFVLPARVERGLAEATTST